MIVNHLSKYLWTRLCVEPPANGSIAAVSAATTSATLPTGSSTENDFQIFICLNDKLPNVYQMLNHNTSLEQIVDKHWKLNRPIELFYYLKSNSCNGNSTEQLNGICNNSNSSSISSNSSSSGSYC